MPSNAMRRLVAVVATGTVLGSSVAAAADDPDEAAAGAGPLLHSPQALETMAEPRWRFSAGAALGLPGLYGFRAVGVGGWFAVGPGRLRSSVQRSVFGTLKTNLPACSAGGLRLPSELGSSFGRSPGDLCLPTIPIQAW